MKIFSLLLVPFLFLCFFAGSSGGSSASGGGDAADVTFSPVAGSWGNNTDLDSALKWLVDPDGNGTFNLGFDNNLRFEIATEDLSFLQIGGAVGGGNGSFAIGDGNNTSITATGNGYINLLSGGGVNGGVYMRSPDSGHYIDLYNDNIYIRGDSGHGIFIGGSNDITFTAGDINFEGGAPFDFSAFSPDPSCGAFEYRLWANSSDGKFKICENGNIRNVYNQDPDYSPSRAPSSCSACDEFTGGTTTGVWFNQGSATSSLEMDGLTINGDVTGDELRGYAWDPPLNQDFTLTVKVHVSNSGGAGNGCGIGILDGGTMAAPTALAITYISNDPYFLFQDESNFDLSSGAANIWNTFPAVTPAASPNDIPYFGQLRYVDSTRVLTSYWSQSGFLWRQPDTETTTLSADPIKMFVFARDGATCHFEFVRARTDAAGIAGQVGE